MQLSSEEQTFMKQIHAMDRNEFTRMTMRLDDEKYLLLVRFVQKMKILDKKLPNYLDNLLDVEVPLALKSHEAWKKWTLFDSVEQLSESEEMKLALIHFKGNVQYITL